MDEDVYSPSYNPQLPQPQDRGLGSHIIDFIQTLVVFGAIFTVIYLFVAQPHKVSGNSMLPNFYNDDFILTDKLTFRFTQPKKGDVIVLKNPRNESQDFIKRIIATPGDTIKIENSVVYVNDQPLLERYLAKGTQTSGGNFLVVGERIAVGANQFFVLGDNRNHSSDSREWGPVTKQEIVGRVFFRYWPPPRFGIVNFL